VALSVGICARDRIETWYPITQNNTYLLLGTAFQTTRRIAGDNQVSRNQTALTFSPSNAPCNLRRVIVE